LLAYSFVACYIGNMWLSMHTVHLYCVTNVDYNWFAGILLENAIFC